MGNAKATEKAKQPTTLTGKVISCKAAKTIIVTIEEFVKHPKYGKYVKRKAKRYAHDEQQIAKENDVVSIRQTKPFSKTKSWVLVEVISSAN